MGPTARRESQSTAPAPSLPIEAVPEFTAVYTHRTAVTACVYTQTAVPANVLYPWITSLSNYQIVYI